MKKENVLGLRLEALDPNELRKNPKNWRFHPGNQKKLFAEMFDEVGWAGALLFNETTGNLIDGHLRQEDMIKRGQLVPVLIGSWTPEQEKKILMTLDPIAAMAEQDPEIMNELIASVVFESEEAAKLMESMRTDEIDIDEFFVDQDVEQHTDFIKTVTCPKCGESFEL